MALKVKPAVKPPELQKVTFNLPVATVQMVKAYKMAYKREYGEEPDEDYLVNEIIRDYFDSDKAFKRFLADHPEIAQEIEGAKKPRKRRARGEAQAEAGTS